MTALTVLTATGCTTSESGELVLIPRDRVTVLETEVARLTAREAELVRILRGLTAGEAVVVACRP